MHCHNSHTPTHTLKHTHVHSIKQSKAVDVPCLCVKPQSCMGSSSSMYVCVIFYAALYVILIFQATFWIHTRLPGERKCTNYVNSRFWVLKKAKTKIRQLRQRYNFIMFMINWWYSKYKWMPRSYRRNVSARDAGVHLLHWERYTCHGT